MTTYAEIIQQCRDQEQGGWEVGPNEMLAVIALCEAAIKVAELRAAIFHHPHDEPTTAKQRVDYNDAAEALMQLVQRGIP